MPDLIVTAPGAGYWFAGMATDSMSETRKLAAILAADVAGFSRLVGVDEEKTLARLRALRDRRASGAAARRSMDCGRSAPRGERGRA